MKIGIINVILHLLLYFLLIYISKILTYHYYAYYYLTYLLLNEPKSNFLIYLLFLISHAFLLKNNQFDIIECQQQFYLIHIFLYKKEPLNDISTLDAIRTILFYRTILIKPKLFM